MGREMGERFKRVGIWRSNHMSKEQQLCGPRRAERSYSTLKIRRGSHEGIPLIQGKEQQLCFLEQP